MATGISASFQRLLDETYTRELMDDPEKMRAARVPVTRVSLHTTEHPNWDQPTVRWENTVGWTNGQTFTATFADVDPSVFRIMTGYDSDGGPCE